MGASSPNRGENKRYLKPPPSPLVSPLGSNNDWHPPVRWFISPIERSLTQLVTNYHVPPSMQLSRFSGCVDFTFFTHLGRLVRHSALLRVCGFNPIENYWWNRTISPNRHEHSKYLKPPPSFLPPKLAATSSHPIVCILISQFLIELYIYIPGG